MAETTSNDIFSSSYIEAREKFITAARSADAQLVTFKNPIKGVEEEGLSTDVALVGPKRASSVLVLCSGTHGVEGFCGSGVQTGLLRGGIAKLLPRNLRIVMIHALNPYGFSHLRRVNEDNIDLNRNFINHEKTHPDNPAYDALYAAINPRFDSKLQRVMSLIRLLREGVVKGRTTLKVAITEGQYTHKTGLFYGGTFETWSNEILRKIFKRYLIYANRVVFVDIHTGLGRFGNGELFCRFPSESADFSRMVSWWGERVVSAQASSAASDYLTGTTAIAVSEMLPDAEVSSVTLEFGTFGPIKFLRAMQAENWLHHHGDAAGIEFDLAKLRMKQAFYPESYDWKRRIWEQGSLVAHQAIRGLENGG